MDTLAKIGRAERRIVRAQRRLWLAQVFAWPTLLLVAVMTLGGVAVLTRRRRAGGRHELPVTPGAHRAAIDYTSVTAP